MLLSHMDKDHPKNESRWSVYIHSGQFWPVWRNQIFPSIKKKVKIEWKSIYVFICTQTEAAKPTGVTDNENPSPMAPFGSTTWLKPFYFCCSVFRKGKGRLQVPTASKCYNSKCYDSKCYDSIHFQRRLSILIL